MGTDLLLALSGLAAGTFGALLGLGGGVLIVPLLSLAFGLPLSSAVGTSLVCVVATSTGGAAHNVRAGRADVRLGVLLGAGTVLGAAIGGHLAGLLPERAVAGLFAALLAYTALTMARGLVRRGARATAPPDDAETDPTAPDGPRAPPYRRRRLGVAVGGSFAAGTTSGLLGVGGGIVAVPLLHLVMRAPLHVAVATSNFIMGCTAAAGAYAYLFRGDVQPGVAGPVVLGVTAGAVIGARLAPRVRAEWLAALFGLVLTYAALQMALRAAGAT